MSAIHDAARTVEQAAQAEAAKLAAILDEAEDLQLQIGATEERLRNLRGRLATCTEDLTAQRRVNEQAVKLAEVAHHLDIKAAAAPLPLDPSITQAEGFAVVQVAKPVMQGDELVCDWASCGMDLIGSDVDGWVHAETGREECKPKPPALQQGTGGSPLLTTILPAHGVEVTREDA